MFFDNVKKLKEERDYYKQAYEELKAQLEAWDEELSSDEEVSNDIEQVETKNKFRVRTTFKDLNIPVGTTLYYRFDNNVTVTTADDKNTVSYNDTLYAITKIGCQLRYREGRYGDSGFWTFCLEPGGKTLFEIREAMEVSGTYGTEK